VILAIAILVLLHLLLVASGVVKRGPLHRVLASQIFIGWKESSSLSVTFLVSPEPIPNDNITGVAVFRKENKMPISALKSVQLLQLSCK
jgi:hypothetical protein